MIIYFATLGALAFIILVLYLIKLGPIRFYSVELYRWISVIFISYTIVMTGLGFWWFRQEEIFSN